MNKPHASSGDGSPGVAGLKDVRSSQDPQFAWVVDAYARYFDYVWALVGRLGVAPASLEDVVQEIFVVLIDRREAFRGDSNLRTWLHGITVNVARRHRDKARRRAHDVVDAEPAAPGPSPELHADHQAQLRRLDAMLQQLSEEQREVFVLHDLAELTAPEIAQLLRVKLNTVYSRLRLARRRMEALVAVLDGRGVENGAA